MSGRSQGGQVVNTNTVGIGYREYHKEDRLSTQILLVLIVREITRRTGCQHKYYWYWLSGRSQGGQVVSTNTIGIDCQGDHKEDKLSAQILLVLIVRAITRRTGCQHKYYWYWLSGRSQGGQVVSTNIIGVDCQGDHKEDRLSAQMLLVLIVSEVMMGTHCQHIQYWH